jgi:hypothetical protein
VIDSEQPRNRRATLDWSRYWTLEEIHDWMTRLSMTNRDISLTTAGSSWEDNQILGCVLNIGGGEGKKQIFFEGTIHSR